MKKKILMIGYNYYPELTGIGKYSGEMIKWLAQEKGYECTVITTYPYYPNWRVQKSYFQDRLWYKSEEQQFQSGGKIKIYRCPMYVPAQPSGLKRILLDLTFLITAFFKLIQLIPGRKFDFVITIAPSFQFGILGILYKKLRKAPFLYHIQDMQIEAARDLNIIKSEKIINALFKLERYIFDQADVVSSISEEMVQKVQQKAGKDVFLFPNWADISLFYPIEDSWAIKQEFGFKPTDKIVLYSGAIGEKQGLESILYAAKALQQESCLKFLICGTGPYKEKLISMAKKFGLRNVFFWPLQPCDKFNLFLSIADVHLVIQKVSASGLMMPSKLTTILAVGGLALVTANKGSGLHSLVEKHNIGMLVEADSQEALNEGIRKSTSDNNNGIKKNARSYAENFISIDKIMNSLVERMEETMAVPTKGIKVLINSPQTGQLIKQEELDPIKSLVLQQLKPDKAFNKDRTPVTLGREDKKDGIGKVDVS